MPDRSDRPRRATIRRVVLAAAAGFLAFVLVGNAVILAAWQLSARGRGVPSFAVEGVRNFGVVDERLWRGDAPSAASLRELAARGVTTVVDLRAEDGVAHDHALLAELGLRLVHIPLRDGQVPTAGEVDRFLDAVRAAPGTTYVHCGAGVGRTGAMVAAYQVARGARTGWGAMRDNLAVGPPSLEQFVFAASLDPAVRRPPALVVAASRVLDAPRRIWSVLRS